MNKFGTNIGYEQLLKSNYKNIFWKKAIYFDYLVDITTYKKSGIIFRRKNNILGGCLQRKSKNIYKLILFHKYRGLIEKTYSSFTTAVEEIFEYFEDVP